MALTPLGVSLSSKYTLTGPDGTIATFNDPTDTNFVGYITELTGLDSPEVRDNGENLAGQDGGVHGPFYYGRRPITITGTMVNLVSPTDREEKITKLRQASNAMRANATLKWTPPGGEAVYVEVRRQQPLRVAGDWAKTYQLMIVSADARIYSQAEFTANATFTESEVLAAGGTKQSAGAITPDGKFVYIPNTASNNLTIYSRNTTTGTLTKLENQATGTSPHTVIISADGKNLYVTNKGANTISKFEIKVTGKLTAVGVAAATGSEPMKAAITKDGKYIYVPNKAGNSISVFERNTSTGELTLKETSAILPAATGPTCVACGENNNTEAGYATVIVGGYTSGKLIQLERKTTGALAVPGIEESKRIVTLKNGTTSMEKILDIDMGEQYFNFTFSGNVNNYNSHKIWVAGENGFVGTASYDSGSSGGATKTQTMTKDGYGEVVFEATTKPNFVTYYGWESFDAALPGQGKAHIAAGGAYWTEEGSSVSYGASAIGNMGKILSYERDIYVPAADKIYEYRVGEKTGPYSAEPTIQKFQNKASGVNITNKGSAGTFAKITMTMAAGQELYNPSIINESNGDVLTFNYTFKENDKLEVDMLNRTVKLNGVNAFSAINLSATTWFEIIPGVNELLVTSEKTTGTPKLTVAWKNAWV